MAQHLKRNPRSHRWQCRERGSSSGLRVRIQGFREKVAAPEVKKEEPTQVPRDLRYLPTHALDVAEPYRLVPCRAHCVRPRVLTLGAVCPCVLC
eukprot:1734093-Rhodomonas_salina.7